MIELEDRDMLSSEFANDSASQYGPLEELFTLLRKTRIFMV